MSSPLNCPAYFELVNWWFCFLMSWTGYLKPLFLVESWNIIFQFLHLFCWGLLRPAYATFLKIGSNKWAFFIYFTPKFSVMGRTEISVSTLHYRNFCTPYYRNFCVNQMKPAFGMNSVDKSIIRFGNLKGIRFKIPTVLQRIEFALRKDNPLLPVIK